MLVRVALGRTINLGNFSSLRVDVAHEVAVEGDRDAAVAEATRLCRADMERLIDEEGQRVVVRRRDLDEVVNAPSPPSPAVSRLVAHVNELAQSGVLREEQLTQTLEVLKAVADEDIPF